VNYRTPVPKASANARQKHRTQSPQNPGLIFERFSPDWSAQPTLKKEALKAVCEAAQKADPSLLSAWNARWQASTRAANAEPFSLRTDWRFVAGLGRKGSLEVGFTFHRYGFPILPGSSVKGVARAYAALVEGRTESDPEFVAAFGRIQGKKEEEAARAGGAVFFDAIPAKLPKLELDIMNPHYPEYYSDVTKRTPPTNWQNPRPVFFLTVAPATEFRFAVGWRGPFDAEVRRLRSLAEKWLFEGLKNLGAGAKTSAGYGYFVETPR
jgi:CRISPR-associated protein Cmr6